MYEGKRISLEEGFLKINSVMEFLGERGFPFRIEGLEKTDWVFSCDLLDEQTGLCLEHEKRPLICRNYVPGSVGTLCYELFKQNIFERLAETTREAAIKIYKTFLAS
jgi:Fe-S-cluster containining protein